MQFDHSADAIPVFTGETMLYLCFADDIAPDTGRWHRHSYVQYRTAKKLNQVKRDFGETAHIEQSRGTPAEAIAYVDKPAYHASFVEFGVVQPPLHPGNRVDISEAFSYIKLQRPTEQQFIDLYPDVYAKYFSATRRLLSLHPPRREDIMPQVDIYLGPTATGKSWAARLNLPDAYYKPDSEWWDGYNQSTTVIYNEFSGRVPLQSLLQVFDRYDHLVPYKGGYTPCLASRFIITSNTINWYPKEQPVAVDALWRRISSVRIYNDPVGFTFVEYKRGDRSLFEFRDEVMGHCTWI